MFPTIEAINETVRESGGCTIDLIHGKFLTAEDGGYVVAGIPDAVKFLIPDDKFGLNDDGITAEHLWNVIVYNGHIFRTLSAVIGIWHDVEAGCYEIEAVHVTQSRYVAEQHCRSRGEKAYYDLARQETVFVN